MSRHSFVRSEYKTTYKELNNSQFTIYCTGCGYVSYDSDLGNNEERQNNLPKQCIE